MNMAHRKVWPRLCQVPMCSVCIRRIEPVIDQFSEPKMGLLVMGLILILAAVTAFIPQ